ncbi:DNA-binding transcriptional regulator, LysR family [Amycolatopsis xylanica]|uniref:DNA-binding transcriptional regulator, LysR family n=1 Tax=Amycolatopsis xylanica TaxID=589385 RepID=A0A1H2SDT2_9PSEU|nr:LysR family transcriptional regulator [Amycolatopsis xylanica]SDW29806.1 DNA-binding transcriptional regulator, LysR family [Amycolatopsis xylanica]
MDLNSLRQFLVVARLEHLSRAAEELRVAQPSVSRTIARLESELGAPLFDRGGRLRLNAAGKLFRAHVERSLGELETGKRAVAEATTEGVRTVRLASETFLTLTAPLAAFKRAHPSVEIELQWSSADDMARLLRARDVDLCLVSQPIHAEGLEQELLLDDEVGVATPLDHPLAGRASVSVEELAGQSFVTARSGHWQRRLLERLFAARGLTPRIVCEVDEPSAIVELIGAGLGIGLVPGFARRMAPQLPLVWVGVDSPDCRRRLTLFWEGDGDLSAAARALRATITGWDWG